MTTTIKFPKSGAFGRDRGGIPVVVEKPNRAMRRLTAKQQKETGSVAKTLPVQPNINQRNTQNEV